MKKQLAMCWAVAMGLAALTGCSHDQSSKLVNEITFSLDSISEVTIAYDEENVTFYESESGDLTIREYMTENKSSYYAKVDQGGGSIKVSEGRKPFFKNGFLRYAEVYLPASYQENLSVFTTDGNIDLSGLEMSLNMLRIDSTAGTVRLNAVKARTIDLSTTSGAFDAEYLDADTIRADTTSGSFSCETLDGNVTYTTTSGSADIRSAIGSGSYKVNNSGQLKVAYTEVTGDLSFFNKNDSIQVTLPKDLEFEFAATTKNGSISISFPECVSIQGRTTSGTVGRNPTVTIKAETNNGNIDITSF